MIPSVRRVIVRPSYSIRPHSPSYQHHGYPILSASRRFHPTAESPAETNSNRPKRPSPYRLLRPIDFQSSHGYLQTSGWLLERAVSDVGDHAPAGDIADLRDHKLVRAYAFDSGKQGWRDVLSFMSHIGQVIEEEDHHPKILITPGSDYQPHTTEMTNSTPVDGHVVEVTTHTHTPRLPLSSAVSTGTPGLPEGRKIRPGVTGKDVRLAERIEAHYDQTLRGNTG